MKLNNKGQTLIIFVILIPLLITLMAFVVDISYMYKESNKLENTTKTIIKNVYNERLDGDIEKKVKDLYKENKIDNKNVKVSTKNEYLIVKNEYEVDSIFGKLIGIKKYKVKVNLKGYEKNNKIVFTKE